MKNIGLGKLSFLVLVILATNLTVVTQASNLQLFWTDTETGTIHRSNLDGTNATTLVTGLDEPRDVEVDFAGGKIYWTDFGADKVQRCNLDGSGKETLVSSNAWPLSIDLDLKNSKMYWTEKTGGFFDRIRRANLNGSSVETLYTYSSGGGGADGITLDVDGGMMYLTCTKGTDHIERRNLNGGNALTLTGAGRIPREIAFDFDAGKMYWTESNSGSVLGTIKRANMNGTDVETLISGLQSPWGIALDLTNQRMYWADYDAQKIQYANLDGSGLTDLQINGLVSPWGITIAVPEPATLALLALGGIMLRRKK